MDSFKKIAKEIEDIKPYERSEFYIYEAMLLEKQKEYKKQK